MKFLSVPAMCVLSGIFISDFRLYKVILIKCKSKLKVNIYFTSTIHNLSKNKLVNFLVAIMKNNICFYI